MSEAKEKYYENVNSIIKSFGNCDGYVNDYVKELEKQNEELIGLIKTIILNIKVGNRLPSELIEFNLEEILKER